MRVDTAALKRILMQSGLNSCALLNGIKCNRRAARRRRCRRASILASCGAARALCSALYAASAAAEAV